MAALDPYLLWAELTDYRDVARDSAKRLAVAIECEGSVAALQQAIVDGALEGVELPGRYHRHDGAFDPAKLHFCTALVEREHLRSLAGHVKRFKLGLAVDARPPDPAPASRTVCTEKVVVGIIDDFVACANPCFRDADGHSRVRLVWSQDSSRPPGAAHWRGLDDFGYGHELDTTALAPGTLRETYPTVLRRATHGTHVADLAAGARAANADEALPGIIAVHLPRRGVTDTSGSALKVQALDALHYIVDRAGAEASVVVNLSYGTMAGPHDGTSILEQAIDELVTLRKGQLSVVLPAGNGCEARCHAVVRLGTEQRRATLRWNILPDDATPSYLEVWLPAGAAACVGVQVTDPGGRRSAACRAGTVWPEEGTNPARVDFGVIFLDAVADGATGTMILVAVAPTQARDPAAVVAPAGVWRVELTSLEGAADCGDIQAWIERDDSLPGQPVRGRQSYFVDPHYERPGQHPGDAQDDDRAYVKRRGAFNTIATGRQSIVVGGYVGPAHRVAAYSGGGPTRSAYALGPTLLECSEETSTLHGLLGAATMGVDRVRMNGTSVAAPLATRRIAQWLLSPREGGGPARLRKTQIVARFRKLLLKLPAHRGLAAPHAGPAPLSPERGGIGRVAR